MATRGGRPTPRKCTTMRIGNQQGSCCGTCIKVCPWNKPYTPFHRAVGWLMRRSGAARSLAIAGDDMMGYGKPHPEDQWWLDLEEVDGIIRIPKKRTGRICGTDRTGSPKTLSDFEAGRDNPWAVNPISLSSIPAASGMSASRNPLFCLSGAILETS